MNEENNTAAVPTSVMRGRVRVDGRTANLSTRLEPGDIAVINQPDLDRATAHLLASKSPAAVLNAAPSATGRHRVLGPKTLLESGVIVIDDLGQDIMTLREGETVTVSDAQILRGDDIVAVGHRLSGSDLEQIEQVEDNVVSSQIGSFAASIDDYLAQDGPALFDGEGVPRIGGRIRGKVVLLVLDSADSAAQLKALRAWIGDTDPLVVGVDGGADIAAQHRRDPKVVIGDMDLVGESVLRHAKTRIVRQSHDGIAHGKARLDRMGLDCQILEMAGTSEDAAVLALTHSGAAAIVVVGGHHEFDDVIDRGRSAMSPSFFTRLVAGDRLIAAPAVAASHRPRIGRGYLLLLLVALLVGFGAALWSTPWGRDLFTMIGHWIFDPFVSATSGPTNTTA